MRNLALHRKTRREAHKHHYRLLLVLAFATTLSILILSAELTGAVAPPPRPLGESRPVPPLPDGALYRLGSLRLRHQGRVTCVAVSPDGKTVASAGEDSVIRVWNRTTGELRWQVKCSRRSFSTFAFAPGGHTIAVSIADDTVTLFATATGKQVGLLRKLPACPFTACFARDGTNLAIGDSKNTVQLWDIAARRMITTLSCNQRSGRIVTGVAFLPNGKVLASCGEDEKIRIWDVATRKTIHVLVPPWPKANPSLEFDRKVTAISVSADGKYLASGYWQGSVCIWSTRTWTATQFIQLDRRSISGLAYSPAGTLAWAGDKLGIYDPRRRKSIWQRDTAPCAVAFAPDGEMLVSGHDNGLIKIRDARTGKAQPSYPGHAGGACSVAFSPSGDTLASLGADDVVRLWELATQRQLRCWKISTTDLCPSLDFSPLSEEVMFAARDKTITFGSPAKGGVQTDLTLHRAPLVFTGSPNGKRIAVLTSADGPNAALDLYDVRTSKRLFQMQQRARREESNIEGFIPYEGALALRAPSTGCLAFSPDGRLLASSYRARAIFLWDLRTRKRLATLARHVAPVQGLSFSPDGTYLVSCASGDENLGRRSRLVKDTLRVWHVARRRQVGELRCPGLATAVSYSPAGDLLASVSDGSIQVWEAASGIQLFQLQDESPNCAYTGHFSPNGNLFATAMSGGTVLVWSLRPPGWAPPQSRLSPGKIERLWQELAAKAPPQAYRAALTLASDARVVAFLEKRLRRVEHETPQRIKQLIDDLDHESFARRQAAEAVLAKIGFQAETALRKAQVNPPSLEVRTRLTRLLVPLDSCFVADPSTLREVRAVGVLRRVGTPAACRLLEKLAKGAPEALQTRAALAALQTVKSASR